MATPVSLSPSPTSLYSSSTSYSSAPVEPTMDYIFGLIPLVVMFCCLVLLFISSSRNGAKGFRQRTNWSPRQETEPTGPHLVDRLRRASAVSATQTLQGSTHNAETEGIGLERLSRVPNLTVEAAEEVTVTSLVTGDGVQSQEHDKGSAKIQGHAQSATEGEQASLADHTSGITVAQILDSPRTEQGVSSPAATTSDDVLRSVNALGYEPISDVQRGKDREEALKQLEGY
ncbi:hypothetical protein N431DRAFT_425318 [Stipitochalara longipes BDJ]|nr:hypothetical protein N431DRAFT_425318 [Stipitochalara longipes BDJ]